MIYTVTLNPAIDKTVEIPSFTVDAVNRVTRIQEDPGGKGINVSKVIECLGGESVAYALLGGNAGEKLMRLLSDSHFQVVRIRTERETRTNMKVVDPNLHTNTDINEPGGYPGDNAIDELARNLEEKLGEGDILVLSGSVPDGVSRDIYAELTRMGNRRGARVILDADGPLLSAGIEAVPFLVKPNRDELSRYFERPLETEEELLNAGMSLLQKGVSVVVISLGGDGAIMCRKDGCIRADGLTVPVASTVGAGDSMAAAFAYGMDRGLDMESTFRLSVAAGSAAVTCSGSQAPDADLVRTLYGRVTLRDPVNVRGSVSLSDPVNVRGSVSLSDPVNVSGSVSLRGSVNPSDPVNLSGENG